MGELIKIIDFLEKKHYAKYCWAYDRTRYSSTFSIGYMYLFEDCHGYSLAS